jgi:hypothetical protein
VTFFNDADAFFDVARRALGNPVATVVEPYQVWEDRLPAGYEYNPSTDAIEDKTGNVLTDVAQYWTIKRIHILPNPQNYENIPVLAGGIGEAATESFFVYGHREIEFVRQAFRVLLTTGEYVVSSVNTVTGVTNQYAEVTVKRLGDDPYR